MASILSGMEETILQGDIEVLHNELQKVKDAAAHDRRNFEIALDVIESQRCQLDYLQNKVECLEREIAMYSDYVRSLTNSLNAEYYAQGKDIVC